MPGRIWSLDSESKVILLNPNHNTHKHLPISASNKSATASCSSSGTTSRLLYSSLRFFKYITCLYGIYYIIYVVNRDKPNANMRMTTNTSKYIFQVRLLWPYFLILSRARISTRPKYGVQWTELAESGWVWLEMDLYVFFFNRFIHESWPTQNFPSFRTNYNS